MNPDPVAGAGAPLPYHSEPLAALLDVFSLWGSGGFIARLSRLAGAELEPTSIVAVMVLARSGRIRPSALAERLGVGASNVSKLSARLIALGLVEKSPDPADSRASLLGLTDEGRSMSENLVASGDWMMSRVLIDWSPADRAEFARLLRLFETGVADFATTLQHPDSPHTKEK